MMRHNINEVLVLNADAMPVNLLPVTTLTWQDAIKAIWINSVRPVAYYEDWVVHSPSLEMRVPSVVMTQRYIHVGKSVGFNDNNIFLRDRYRCQYCGKQFHYNDLTWDHVIPKKYGGKSTWENIATSCSPCNSNRGANQKIQPFVKPYRPSYYELIDKLREFPIQVPHESWLEFLMWPEDNISVKIPKRQPKLMIAA